jgi:3-deoxy-manno-octulosonate cytidylyltransferase (CMP-KDO synthetase)
MTEELPIIIVPARLASVRFPRKLLQEVNGIPLIIHTARRLVDVAPEFDILFAVDGDELESVLSGNGFETIMTNPDHPSGTDRIFAANQKAQRAKVINVQADEPLVQRDHILSLAEAINRPGASMATLAVPFDNQEDFDDRNQVKVVLDRSGFALYFSRIPIPQFRESSSFQDFLVADYRPLKHLGLYGYTRDFLLKFSQTPQGKLEYIEKLEQLRALEMGENIAVSVVKSGTIGIDVPADLEKLHL